MDFDEVTPADVHLVITPTTRGHDLFAAIAVPATATPAEARRAARDMRRSASGDRLAAACIAEVVLGDPAHHRDYQALRERCAAAGVPVPAIGPIAKAVALPPPARVRAQRWLRAAEPKVMDFARGALTITGRGLLGILKIVLIVALFIAGIALLVWLAPPAKPQYEPPPIRYTPPTYDFKIPEYQVPKFEMPDFKMPESVNPRR